MKKLDYQTLTEVFNKFRMEHLSRTYTREEILAELANIGIKSAIAYKMFSKGYIPSEKVGKAKLYSFGKDPVHKSQIEALYREKNLTSYKSELKRKAETKQLTSEEAAIELLQSKGFQVRKVIGFDMERFQKENPVIYKRYLKYEII